MTAKNSTAWRGVLFEASLDGIIVADAAGRLVDVNPAMCRMLEAEPRALRGAELRNFCVHEDDAAALFDALRAHGTFNGVFPVRATSGSVACVEWRARGDFVADHHLCIGRDVTQRRRAEQQAASNNAWLHTTLSSIGDAVIATDADGRVVFMNPVAEALTGWTQADAVSRPLQEVFRIVNEHTRDTVPNPVDKVRQTGKIVGLANHTVLLARDGREVAIDDSAAPIAEPGGVMAGAVLVFRDIGERRRLELESRRLAAIVECSDDAIVGKNLDGIVTSWNDAAQRIFGYTAEEMIGRPIATLVPPERPDEEPGILQRIRRGERIDHFETVRVRKDGSRLDVSVTISPIKDSQGRIVGASKVARDISKEKALRAELQERVAELAEADARKDEFLAMLAHELRNPLGAISNAVAVLVQPERTEAMTRRAIEVLNRQVRHQSLLVDELLDVSRMTRGLIELRLEELDLVGLVRDAVADYRAELQQQQLRLELDLPDHPVRVRADPTRMTQVVSNLLSNAIKFSDPGGRVTVRLRADEQRSQAALTVEDTGIGIPPDLLPRVFDSFSHGDRTLARSSGGLGLGLAIVKGLVELHEGTVNVRSDGQDRGTTFVVELPLLAVHEEARRPPASDPDTTSLRVLVIEDHRDAAEMLRSLLQLLGHEVEMALTGAEGIRLAREHHPDVILCDLGLPGMNGYEVAAALRTDPGGPPHRLVAVTGYGQEQDRRRTREAGFAEHLVKPIDADRLRAVLARLLRDADG